MRAWRMQLCGARRCRSGLCFRVFMAWKQQHEGRVSYATRHRLMVSMLIGSNARECLACAQAELCAHVCVQVSRWCHAKDTCKTCYGLCRCLVRGQRGSACPPRAVLVRGDGGQSRRASPRSAWQVARWRVQELTTSGGSGGKRRGVGEGNSRQRVLAT